MSNLINAHSFNHSNEFLSETAIRLNLKKIQQRVDQACLASNRKRDSVKILLATKTVPIEAIKIAYQEGYGLFGENKVQELGKKNDDFSQLPVNLANPMMPEIHLIGHLQSNKIKDAVKYSDCIQSIDRISLAYKLNQYCESIGKKQNILIQVNTSYETTKEGICPEKLFDFLAQFKPLSQLHIQGLMTLGLNSTDPILVRQGFSQLRELSRQAQDLYLISQDANILSMGMSADLEWAIAEGATMIRIGSAIFGQRNQSATV